MSRYLRREEEELRRRVANYERMNCNYNYNTYNSYTPNNKKASIITIIGVLICCFACFSGVFFIAIKDNSSSQQNTKTISTNKQNNNEPIKVNIGEEFNNDTIMGVVTYADLDYKEYGSLLTVDNNKKVLLVKIKVTNISNESNYVSVGDFDCYVDNVKINAELLAKSGEDYNANIEAGRSAILGGVYVIPKNAQLIELEYNPIGENSNRIIITIADENTQNTTLGENVNVSDENINIADDSINDVNIVNIGEEFGNQTIIGVVQEANLNYTDYDDLWTQIPDGKKAIYIKIKVTNISNESNYVSVGDFDCYVDDVIVEDDLNVGSDENYNANIEAGRSAILGALYIIPQDATSIELEYNPIGEYAKRTIIKIQ